MFSLLRWFLATLEKYLLDGHGMEIHWFFIYRNLRQSKYYVESRNQLVLELNDR